MPLLVVVLGKVVEVNRRHRALVPPHEFISELREGRITDGQHAADVRQPCLNLAPALIVTRHPVPLLPRVGVRRGGGETAADVLGVRGLARATLLLREVAPLEAVVRGRSRPAAPWFSP